MRVDDRLRNRQAEAAVTAGGAGFVRAVEAFEKVRQIAGGNRGAGIADDERREAVGALGCHLDLAALVVVVDGVAQQVGDDLRETFRVAAARRGREIGVDAEAAGSGQRAEEFDTIGRDFREIAIACRAGTWSALP